MAQIEAFLRTGEGPPPAPEPRPSPEAPTAEGDRRRSAGPARGLTGRVAGSGVGRRLVAARHRGGPSVRRGYTWSRSGGGMHPSEASWGRGGRLPGDPPRWTVTRVVLLVAFIVGLLLVPVLWRQHSGRSNPDGTDHASTAPAGPAYSFLQVNRSGTPVRWNPCSTIAYQLDLASAPAWAETDIAEALMRISTATGIQFTFEGSTNQFPTGQVPPGSATGQQPVVIAWADPAQSRDLDLPVDLSGASGSTGSSIRSTASSVPTASASSVPTAGSSVPAAGSSVSGPAASSVPAGSALPDADSLARTVPVMDADQVTGHSVYVTGSVVISSAASGLPAGFAPGADGVLLLHQFGRLLGLGNIADRTQVMNPGVLSTSVTSLGPGDLAGLKRLGAGSGCLKPPADGAIEPVL